MKSGKTATDLIVYGFILAFVAMQFAFCLRCPGFINGEAVYVELARSIIEKQPYGFDFMPETRFPPGFPLILALISQITNFNFGAMLRAMTVFIALGFIASYELIRREEGRLCAGLTTLVLLSSPPIFDFATKWLFPEFPYLLFSLLVLLAARKLEIAEGTWEKTGLWLTAAIALIITLMLRTVGVALLTGLILWLAVSYIAEKRFALGRLKSFLPLLILGILVQGIWTHWGMKMKVAEWPLSGYPGSYFSEFWLKRGNYPELGNASQGEILLRLGRNLIGYGLGFITILSRKDYIAPLWFSPATISPILLICMGVASRVRRGGGSLLEWYFISYMAMFLLWPWDYEIRFLLPVLPLVSLYLWCGITELIRLGCEKTRTIALAGLPFCMGLAVLSIAQGSKIEGAQPRLSIIFWLALSIFSIFVLWNTSRQSTDGVQPKQWFFKENPWAKIVRLLHAPWITIAVTIPLIVMGFLMQIQVGRDNLQFNSMTLADVRAAQYVNLHTDRNAVIMAGHRSIIYNYCRRRVVWFPPISNPQLLMDGIRKFNVSFIIVIDRDKEYWLPPEFICFKGLAEAYPGAFHLAYREPKFTLYEVTQ